MVRGVYSNKRSPKILATLGLLLSLILPGCRLPSLPLEVKLIERLNQELWKAQANVYAPEEYKSYEPTLKKVIDDFIKEEAKVIWFRDYEPIAGKLKAVLRDGEGILKKVQQRKEARRLNASKQLSELDERVKGLGSKC